MMQTENKKPVDVVIDSDAFNEIDDQFAIAYAFCSSDKINIIAIYSAPFDNDLVDCAKTGMEKSFAEIKKLVSLTGNSDGFKNIYKGSEEFLTDEKTPVKSSAAEDLVARAMEYTAENPLYVIAIAALTNVASAILLNPKIAERIVLVWLGGNANYMVRQNEFNMRGDITAVNVCFKNVKQIVQLPCAGVVSDLITTGPELDYWLGNKNKLCDYLVDNVKRFKNNSDYPWSKQIWDVAAVAYLVGNDNEFMLTKEERVPTYTADYKANYLEDRGKLTYVTHIFRDKIFADLFKKLSDERLFKTEK